MSPYDDYLKIAAEWEAEFARNQRRYGEKIHCRKGCSDCCSQMFQITELEAAYISRAVKELLPEARLRMEQRAREYLPQREALLERRDVPVLSVLGTAQRAVSLLSSLAWTRCQGKVESS